MLNDEKNLENQEDTNDVSANLDQSVQADDTAEKTAELEAAAEITPTPDDIQTEEVVEAVFDMAPPPAESQDTPAPVANEEKPEEGTEEILEKLISESASASDNTAHDDFDWDSSDEDVADYSPDEFKALASEYEGSLKSLTENQIVDGVVREISGRDVIIDLNYKADGIVSLTEFRDAPDLKPGDTVAVYVEALEDKKGQLVLSRRKAKILRAWESLVKSYNEGTIVTGTVVSKTKGGLIVDVGGLETFLPGSQIDIRPIIDYDAYVGKTMEFKVVKINEAIKNAVVSHKALIESDLAEQRDKIVAKLERGQVLEGVVKNITDFGAFMDLGGVDGLLYITDISWGRIKHPSEVLELNQKLNVVVLDFDEDKKRISLSLKQLQPHPWETLDENIKEGSVVEGKVVNVEDYGAFLEIIPGVEGLVHVSEVSWSNQPINAKEFFKLGEKYQAKVVTIDRDEKKMSLSIKQLSEDPWNTIEKKFAVGTKHTGLVKNLTPYGVFVELDNGIGGMIHISDLSWLKRYSHPSEFTKVGENIDVIVLDIDKENRKLSLGHKQLEENPWDTFESVFPEGSYHEGTIVRRDDKGAIVQLPYGLEAFAPIKHIKKENGQLAEVNDTLTFKVLEFNRDDKRILVSHTRYLDDIRREAGELVEGKKRKEREETRKIVKKLKPERTTLGELDAFSELKKQLEEQKAEQAAPVEKPTAEVSAVEEAPKVEEKPAEEVKASDDVAVAEVKEEAPAGEKENAGSEDPELAKAEATSEEDAAPVEGETESEGDKTEDA